MSQHEPSSAWKKATLAGFLSLLIAGMGQLYDRRPRKALWLALTIPILLVLAAQTRIVFSFFTMVVFFTILIGWRLFIAQKQPTMLGPLRSGGRTPASASFLYSSAVVLLAAAFYPSYDDFQTMDILCRF